jgi:hypothetical protein
MSFDVGKVAGAVVGGTLGGALGACAGVAEGALCGVAESLSPDRPERRRSIETQEATVLLPSDARRRAAASGIDIPSGSLIIPPQSRPLPGLAVTAACAAAGAAIGHFTGIDMAGVPMLAVLAVKLGASGAGAVAGGTAAIAVRSALQAIQRGFCRALHGFGLGGVAGAHAGYHLIDRPIEAISHDPLKTDPRLDLPHLPPS